MHTMASTDAGTLLHKSPDASQTRDSTDVDSAANGGKRRDDLNLSQSRQQCTQRDILHVLERLGASRDANEPASKKARLSESDDATASITSKLRAATYLSLEQLKTDAARISQDLVSSIRTKLSDRDAPNGGRPSVDELKQIHRIQAFEVLIKDVADKELRNHAAQKEKDVESKAEVDEVPNGHIQHLHATNIPRSAGTVLTLFGNAPTPKQLFSSMQHPTNARTDIKIKNELIVEEMSLPNGLAATKVMAVPTEDLKKTITFEDAFAPPYSLSALQPPKSHKRSSTRDSHVTWEFKDPIQRNGRKGGYTVQSLTVSDWLSYGGVDPEHDPSSPRERRKLRDRALSSGEATHQPPSKASLEEALAREEEILFRKAFSSFAPTHDNAKALVPEETKNMVWWHKVGNKRFNETFAIDPALLDESSASSLPLPDFDEIEIDPKNDDFSKIVDDLDDLDTMQLDEPDQPARSKTDTDQVLREISELLETLASHQRIRNASLSSSTSISRTPISPAPTLTAKIGKPDEPAEDELSTYASLRRELTYLLLKLPPYAVSKLNGDQLAELAISRVIPLETKNVQGTMEDDQVSRQAKLAAMATASSIASLTRPNSSAGQHYSTTAQRTPAIGQAANTRYGQSAQYGARTPVMPQYQRSAPTPQQYANSPAPRPAYSQSNQYNRPGAPQTGYGQQPNGQQYYQQRPMQQTPGGYGSYNPQYHQATQQRPSYAAQPMMQYQRSHAAATSAVAYQTGSPAQQNAYNRTVSPAKPTGYSVPPQQPPIQQRSSYSSSQQQPGSGVATPTQYSSKPQTPVNGYQPPPTPQQRPQQAVAPRPASATPQPPSVPPSAAPASTQNTSTIQTNGTL